MVWILRAYKSLTFSDSFVDCEDVDCCSQTVCQSLSQCQVGRDPISAANNYHRQRFDNLYQSSFFNRVAFLINDDRMADNIDPK